MDTLDALVLGLVEGVTEFLPVSSTGHLLVAQRALGLPEDDVAHAFAICIQLGAILAVVGLYAGRIRRILAGLAGRDPPGRQLGLELLVAFLPAAVVGLALAKPIERVLFGPWPVVVAWIVGGLGILVWERRKRTRGGAAAGEGPAVRSIEQVGLRTAFLIGVWQCLALWPGTSRSLVTILGAALLGLSLPAAVEFSFLLGAVTLGAATAYKGLQHGSEMIHAFGPVPLLVGFLAALVSAALAVRWMIGWLSSHGLSVFAWWRIGAGLGVAALLLLGLL